MTPLVESSLDEEDVNQERVTLPHGNQGHTGVHVLSEEESGDNEEAMYEKDYGKHSVEEDTPAGLEAKNEGTGVHLAEEENEGTAQDLTEDKEQHEEEAKVNEEARSSTRRERERGAKRKSHPPLRYERSKQKSLRC